MIFLYKAGSRFLSYLYDLLLWKQHQTDLSIIFMAENNCLGVRGSQRMFFAFLSLNGVRNLSSHCQGKHMHKE